MMRRTAFVCLALIAAAITACATPPSATMCEATGLICPADSHCAAAQPICLKNDNTCGNAHPDPGEACDDGNNLPGDGCSPDCKSNEKCGNGTLDHPIKDSSGNVVASDPRNEDCDTPLAVDPNTGFFCSAVCKFEKCGNMVIDKEIGEQCDDGNTIGGDGCSADCKFFEICGNGHTDQPIKDSNGNPILSDPRNEICDDGNTRDGDGCSSDCRSAEGCGNGTIDPGEECDDGKNPDGSSRNGDDKDCRADCQINRCGDGRPNLNGVNHKEQCDGGPLMPDRNAAATPTETATCNSDCTTAACGDGKVNRHFITLDGVVEQCDAAGANNNNADCTAHCQVNVCGDTHTNSTGVHHEDCDDGDRDDNNACTNACKVKDCGDGIVGPGEDCDDGKDSNGNSRNKAGARCNASCKFNVCGDGDKLLGVEACDGGNGTQRDVSDCDFDCKLPVCGDGHKNEEAGEACDDGPLNGTINSLCSAACQIATCGNAIREQGEACDDGVGGVKTDSPTCDKDCSLARCGDNHENPAAGEECDLGSMNGVIGSLCSATCHDVSCGNGFIEQNEQCDDGKDENGNTRNKAGARCNASCQFNVCGDSDKFIGVEQCDSGGVNTLQCDADCTFPVCGDTITNLAFGETCDNGVLNGTTGNACSSICKANVCGNNHVDWNEECDPGGAPSPVNVAGCNANCTISVCGDGRPNSADGEACDEGLTNGDPCAYGNPMCTRCSSDCTDASFHPGGPFCGDGLRQAAFEDCDPGGGLAPADNPTCLSTCKTSACGDGHINLAASEVCDDFNNNACGTCVGGCGTAVIPAKAAGAIQAKDATRVSTNDTFTLNDGFNPAVTFEFHVNASGVDATNVPVNIDDDATATEVAQAMVTAINGATSLGITAELGGTNNDVVVLGNIKASSLGNTTIGRTGTIAGAMGFTFTNFDDGAAGDCAVGVGCLLAADCASGSCNLTTHKCVAGS